MEAIQQRDSRLSFLNIIAFYHHSNSFGPAQLSKSAAVELASVLRLKIRAVDLTL